MRVGYVFPMDRQRILLANELRFYRQTMAIALQGLRPAAEVTAIEPESFEAEVERRRPHVVICSRNTPACGASSPYGSSFTGSTTPRCRMSASTGCVRRW